MKILITGGTGYIGGAMTRRLLDRGDQVVLLARTPAKAAPLQALGAEVSAGDLTDRASLDRAVAGCDAVVHCAGIPRPATWRVFRRVHVTGTESLVSAARSAGVKRLLYLASLAVVFDGNDVNGSDETLPYPKKFIDPYSQTKAEGEQLALAANDPAGMTVTSVRPAMVWGPGDSTILPIMARLSRSLLGIPVPGDGAKLEATTYIDNLTDGMLAALDSPKASGRTYFLLDDFQISARDFLSRQLEAIGVEPRYCRIPRHMAGGIGWLLDRTAGLLRLPVPLAYFGYRMAVTERCVSTTRAQEDLGYRPAVGLEDGLARLAAWAEQLGGPKAVIGLM